MQTRQQHGEDYYHDGDHHDFGYGCRQHVLCVHVEFGLPWVVGGGQMSRLQSVLTKGIGANKVERYLGFVGQMGVEMIVVGPKRRMLLQERAKLCGRVSEERTRIKDHT